MKSLEIWIMAGLGIGVLLGLRPDLASAQSIWLDHRPSKSLSVEVLKPSLDRRLNRGSDATLWTSLLFFTGRYPLTERLVLTADLPLSHYGVDRDFGDTTATVMGNPYLGVEFGHRQGTRVVGELGLRPPWGEEGKTPGLGSVAMETGLLTELTERFDAFLRNTFALTGAVNYFYESKEGFGLRLRGRPSALFFEGDDDELWITYSVQGWYNIQRWQVGGGLSGLLIAVTDPDFDLDLSERLWHQVGIGTIGHFRHVQPGVHFRVPVDKDLRDATDFTIGLSLTVPFR